MKILKDDLKKVNFSKKKKYGEIITDLDLEEKVDVLDGICPKIQKNLIQWKTCY